MNVKDRLEPYMRLVLDLCDMTRQEWDAELAKGQYTLDDLWSAGGEALRRASRVQFQNPERAQMFLVMNEVLTAEVRRKLLKVKENQA